MAARAITAGELIKLRRDNQSTRLYVAFLIPAEVYSARVNQTFTTTDEITQITYDTGSGTLANVQIGMTLLVGSSAGAYDLGFCRIRSAPDATTFYISEESEIDWDNDLYLTVVRDFQLLPKHIKLDADGVAFMDVSVAYSDQHASPNPVPVLGPHVRVLKLAPTTASIAFSGSSSYVIGSTISTYAWVCATCSASSGTGTATPTFTFNTVGWHLVECTVTAATTLKTKIGYRWVYVYDDANKPAEAQLEECTGDAESGGQAFTVTMYDQASLTLVRDRALCVLFAEDVYGTEAGSLGPVSGAESTICWGWVAGETIVLPPSGRGGEVSFEAQGPQQWLARIPAFPVGLEDVQAAPTVWTEFEDLTVRKGAWHMLEWRTTATTIIDVNLTSDTRGLPSFEGGRGNLWDQLVQNCVGAILAYPRCDRYGSLYVDVDANYTPEADRSSFPNVMDLTRPDWIGQIQGERVTVPGVGQVNSSGISYIDGEATSIFSLAPGHLPHKYGVWEVKDRFILSSQSQANTLCGLIAAKENNQFPSLSISLAANNRFFDIAPAQYVRLTVAATDTARGFSFTNKRFIPRRVRYLHDRETGMLTCDLEVEAEVFPELAITGDAPSTPPELPLPPIAPLPPIITFPGLPAEATEAWFVTDQNQVVYSEQVFDDAISQPTWKVMTLPSDMDSSVLWTGTGQGSFVILADGSAAYISGKVTSTTDAAIWRCTDPKAASPSWAIILRTGDAVLASTVPAAGSGWVCLTRFGGKLTLIFNLASGHAYGEHNGAWTFYSISMGANDPRNEGTVHRTFTKTLGVPPALFNAVTGAQVGSSWTTTAGDSPRPPQIWRNLITARHLILRTDATTAYIRDVEGNTDLVSGFGGLSPFGPTGIYIRGALRGAPVCFVDKDGAGAGDIFVSPDGSTFTQKTTWRSGIADFMDLTGSGPACWLVGNTTNANEIFRTTADVFAVTPTWVNKTGNYWTEIYTGGAAFNARDLWLVHKRNTRSGQ